MLLDSFEGIHILVEGLGDGLALVVLGPVHIKEIIIGSAWP